MKLKPFLLLFLAVLISFYQTGWCICYQGRCYTLGTEETQGSGSSGGAVAYYPGMMGYSPYLNYPGSTISPSQSNPTTNLPPTTTSNPTGPSAGQGGAGGNPITYPSQGGSGTTTGGNGQTGSQSGQQGGAGVIANGAPGGQNNGNNPTSGQNQSAPTDQIAVTLGAGAQLLNAIDSLNLNQQNTFNNSGISSQTMSFLNNLASQLPVSAMVGFLKGVCDNYAWSQLGYLFQTIENNSNGTAQFLALLKNSTDPSKVGAILNFAYSQTGVGEDEGSLIGLMLIGDDQIGTSLANYLNTGSSPGLIAGLVIGSGYLFDNTSEYTNAYNNISKFIDLTDPTKLAEVLSKLVITTDGSNMGNQSTTFRVAMALPYILQTAQGAATLAGIVNQLSTAVGELNLTSLFQELTSPGAVDTLMQVDQEDEPALISWLDNSAITQGGGQ